MECNKDSLSVAVPSRVKKYLRACATPVIPPRQISCEEATEEIRKESNFSLAQESIHLAAVTLAVDGGIRERRSLTPFKTKFVTRNVTQILKNIQIGK